MDGQELAHSLFESIMSTQASSNPNNVLKFCDNSRWAVPQARVTSDMGEGRAPGPDGANAGPRKDAGSRTSVSTAQSRGRKSNS